MDITVLKSPRDEWEVWAQLEQGDPVEQPFSFVIGMGSTRDEAVAQAVQSLEKALDYLQGWHGH